MDLASLGEKKLIERISFQVEEFQKKDTRIITSIGDDTAVITDESKKAILLTTDAMVDSVHFVLDAIDPEDLGYKSIAINVSDIAAMAGSPEFAVITLGLCNKIDVQFIDSLYDGMLEAGKEFGVSLVGGDMCMSPTMFINVTMTGESKLDRLCLRKDATNGDVIMVSGALGAAAAGLEVNRHNLRISPDTKEYVLKRHNRPRPRVLEAKIAADSGANAMQDISDGLATDLNHILKASECGATIFEQQIPIDRGVEEVARHIGKTALDLALYGGEDYELVFTIPRGKAEKIDQMNNSKEAAPMTKIGEITDSKSGIYIVDAKGMVHELVKQGYEHFK